MGLRFRRSVRVFPGVRLNFSGRGLSTTIGVRGASVNLGSRGTYVNLGLPGTGLSYREKVAGGEHARTSSVERVVSGATASQTDSATPKKKSAKGILFLGLGLALLVCLAAQHKEPLKSTSEKPVAGSTAPTEVDSPTAPSSSDRSKPSTDLGMPRDSVYVQKDKVNIRSEPFMVAPIVGRVSRGKQFIVFQEQGAWSQIGDGPRPLGWILSRLLGQQK